MSSDIISSLQLERNIPSSRVIVAKEINGSDSTFITSCVLGHCIKNRQAVLLVTTHNSLLHYQNIGLKMNYNLQKQIDSGLVNHYKVDEEIVKHIMNNEGYSLLNTFSSFKERYQFLKDKHNVVNIIFDGVSHLFDLQHTLSDVNKLCKQIIDLTKDHSGSFVLFHCNVASDEDVTCVMATLLGHMAHTVAVVGNLSSGWSADVSGHLTISHPGYKFENEHMFTLDIKSNRYLFKLFDRGVKLFAPGTV